MQFKVDELWQRKPKVGAMLAEHQLLEVGHVVGGLISHKCIVLKRNERKYEQGSQSDCKSTKLILQSSCSHKDRMSFLTLF